MIMVLAGTYISWVQVQDAAHRHVPPEELTGFATFGPALPRSVQASYTASRSGNLLENLLSGGR